MSPTLQGATITRITEIAGVDATGKPTSTIRVEFNVGSHGPFYETFPKKDFTAAAAKQKLDSFAQTITGLTGNPTY